MTTTSAHQKWIDAMVLELRLRDVRGTAIGDAVAAVETHCQEAGETPLSAFGDPREYARALHFRRQDLSPISRTGWLAVLAPVAAGLVAITLVGPLARAVVDRSAVPVSWGEIASLGLLVLVVLLFLKFLEHLVDRLVVFAIFLGLSVAAMVAVTLLWPATAFSMPTWLAAVVTVCLLAASVVGHRKNRMRDSDPIVDPRDGRQQAPLLSVATDWIFVIVAVGVAALTWVPMLFR